MKIPEILADIKRLKANIEKIKEKLDSGNFKDDDECLTLIKNLEAENMDLFVRQGILFSKNNKEDAEIEWEGPPRDGNLYDKDDNIVVSLFSSGVDIDSSDIFTAMLRETYKSFCEFAIVNHPDIKQRINNLKELYPQIFKDDLTFCKILDRLKLSTKNTQLAIPTIEENLKYEEYICMTVKEYNIIKRNFNKDYSWVTEHLDREDEEISTEEDNVFSFNNCCLFLNCPVSPDKMRNEFMQVFKMSLDEVILKLDQCKNPHKHFKAKSNSYFI